MASWICKDKSKDVSQMGRASTRLDKMDKQIIVFPAHAHTEEISVCFKSNRETPGNELTQICALIIECGFTGGLVFHTLCSQPKDCEFSVFTTPHQL